MHLLVTGASGKLGRRVIARLLREPLSTNMRITALTHSRQLDISDERLTERRGNIADRSFVEDVMRDITHVVHMATCKEMPELVMDVTVKGMFWLTEAFRAQKGDYFLLVGGDAALGHYCYPANNPLTEVSPHRATPGCYALSKVLEEVMLKQVNIQYGLQGCCLRAPWIVADDDLRYALSFSKDVFGVPVWHEEVGSERAQRYALESRIPLALAADGSALQRGIIAVEDMVEAIMLALRKQPAGMETFNIAMDKPFDYGQAAQHMEQSGVKHVEVPTQFHNVWLDNTKARQWLGWRPNFDTCNLLDAAWAFERASNDVRKQVYPG